MRAFLPNGEQTTFSGPTRLHNVRHTAGMVHLDVIYHKIVDPPGVDYPAYVLDQIFFEGLLDSIEERDFFVDHKIGVIS